MALPDRTGGSMAREHLLTIGCLRALRGLWAVQIMADSGRPCWRPRNRN